MGDKMGAVMGVAMGAVMGTAIGAAICVAMGDAMGDAIVIERGIVVDSDTFNEIGSPFEIGGDITSS